MVLYGLVINDQPGRSFRRSSGEEVLPQIITVVDQDKTGIRLTQSCDVQLVGEDKIKYAGKLLDKRIEVQINNISVFGGRPRLDGRITMIDGKPADTTGK